jgi:hypothetical protein
MKFEYYYYENFFNLQEKKDLLKYCQENQSDFFQDVPGYEKNCRSKLIDTKQTIQKLPFFEKFFDVVKMTNNRYFGFELFKENPLSFNLNTYEENTNEYKLHRDASELGSSCDIKLTAVLNLSEKEYSGGQFVMVFDGEKPTKIEVLNKSGSLLIFPSFYYHGVEPVISGQRISLSCWFEGPNWK